MSASFSFSAIESSFITIDSNASSANSSLSPELVISPIFQKPADGLYANPLFRSVRSPLKVISLECFAFGFIPPLAM